jgi:hypothetical protein
MPETTNTHPEGVPLNIWLVAAHRGDGSSIRHRLAAEAVEAYSPPGGLVVDLYPGRGEGLAAAAAAGRGSVVLPRACASAGRCRAAATAELAGTADLVLALPGTDRLRPLRPHPLSPQAARVLAAQAAGLLHPGGFLVVGSVPVPGTGRDPVSEAVEAATAEGFSYFQHVVALLCDEADDRPSGHVDVLVFARRES